MTNTQITIVCLIKAKKDKKQQVYQKLTDLAKMTRNEKGNINYELHVSSEDECLFIIYENWKDQQALDGHMAQPYLKDFLALEQELVEQPIDGKICKIIS